MAHTNKRAGTDGKKIYAGTSDIVDDFDCAYVLDTVLEDTDTKRKTVEFTNKKKRGNVAPSVSYSYATERNISYNELLLSVQEVDPDQLLLQKQTALELTDGEMINVIETRIKEGVNSKMKLSMASAEHAKVSQRHALKIIEKYTGDDPTIHRWSFVVRERGAKVYMILERPSEHLPTTDITSL